MTGHAGVAHHARHLARWLTNEGHRVTLWSGAGPRAGRFPAATAATLCARVNGNTVRFPALVRVGSARRELHASKFDVVDLQLPCSPLVAAPLLAALPYRTAAVGSFHMATERRMLGRVCRAAGGGCGPYRRRLDAVVAVSATAAQLAVAALRRPAEVIPPVVQPPEPYVVAGIAKSCPIIVFVGRLVPRKGAQLLLGAFSTLVSAGHDCRLVIVGDGPQRAVLERAVIALRLESRVRLTGEVADRMRDELLAASDVICLPSQRGESCGVALVQALGVGHARVVAGSPPGYIETVAGHEEVLVDACQPGLLAERLASALAARPSVEERRWRELVVARHAAEAVGPQMIALYRRAATARCADHG